MVSLIYNDARPKKPLDLRRLLDRDGIIIAPGVFSPLSAVMAEKLGFRALYVSGAALSGSLAIPDIGLLTLHEVVQQVRYIKNSVSIPIIVDADTGFGEALNVIRAVNELEQAGASAIQIEDQEMPKKCGHLAGKRVLSPRQMVEKIRAAVNARRSPRFLIVARIDSRSVHGLEDSIHRARLYYKAGADIIFPEALESASEFKMFSQRIRAPLLANMTEFGKTPYITAKEFEGMGYRIVIFPVTALRVSAKAIEEALKELKDRGSQRGFLKRMQTRDEFYRLIGYREYEERDSRIAKEAAKVVEGGH